MEKSIALKEWLIENSTAIQEWFMENSTAIQGWFIENSTAIQGWSFLLLKIIITASFLFAILSRIVKKYRKEALPIFFAIIDRDAKPHPFSDFIMLSAALGAAVYFYLDPYFYKLDLSNFASINIQIIGILIAITSSFSVFAMQRRADFLPAEYINLFIGHREIMSIYMPLAFLLFVSLFIPNIFSEFPKLALWGLLSILLGAFFFVYLVYVELIQKVTPDYFLEKIQSIIIKDLEACRENHANLHKSDKNYNLFEVAAHHVESLQEIGIRLLNKNENRAFDKVLNSVNAIYLKHLILGDGCFIGNDKHRNYFKDLYLITVLSGCLSSFLDYIPVERNRENAIISMGLMYVGIIKQASCIKYADKAKENIILGLIFTYYKEYFEIVIKHDHFIVIATESLLKISRIFLEKADNSHVVIGHLYYMMEKAVARRLPEDRKMFDSTLSELKKKVKKKI